ncbi:MULTISPECIES: helix-turn-helix domain-containing protein [Mycobacteroides]|uniref:helix-turn-helix domain-containing protein n=1 Tax=Mycobacteroides TaxID=670516 RepID=UPI000C255F69|nr:MULTISPECIES: helix-turn-helix domain-containing protein [Mycobacteroides]MBN7314511.1 helix-turn-helix domain-containing protein [Mycobacteroides abscessus subsp. abscessus]MBV6362596.1 helix-turn-helix domain-containing protein [Mycobacteroides chelonae]PVB11750.1 DNA-binding protein [Mycobacteroides abscessus]RIR12435.1 DNA-binding protein [Mycobacteroides abscessus]RIS55406.1 DNA-binding protein [Mycobacteroides abscessus]
MSKPFSTDELAEHLGVPVRTLAEWRYRGNGPRFAKVGRHIRYRREDVDAWLGERTRQRTGDRASA